MIFQKFYFSGIKAGISGSQPVNFFFLKKRNVCVNKWCLDQDFSIRVSIVSSFDKLSKQTKKNVEIVGGGSTMQSPFPQGYYNKLLILGFLLYSTDYDR